MFKELLMFLLKHNEIAVVFYKVLYLSIIGSIVGGIVLLFRNLFKNKISGKWNCIFWIICLMSLIIPYRYEIKTPIDNKINEITKNVSIIENIKDIPENNSLVVSDNVINNSDEISKDIVTDFNNDEVIKQDKISNDINIYKVFLICIIPYLWLIGVIYFILNVIYGYIRFKSNINRCNDVIVTDILKQSRIKLKVKNHINLYYYNDKIVPSIFGIVSPKILISKDTLNKSDEELKYIFMHELAHYKRCDLIYNFVLLMILSIHFYNPIMWKIYKAVREDIELAADELVIKNLDREQSKEYGLTLLSFLNISNDEYKASFLCLSDTEKNMERRIKMIKKPIKNTLIGILVVLVVSILIGTMVFLKFENKETIVDKIEDEVLNLSKEYEPIWQEPKKINSYEEYQEMVKQEPYDGPQKVSAEEKQNLISEETAKEKTRHILDLSGLEDEQIKEVTYVKNMYKQGIYFIRVFTSSGYEITFNAEDGSFWYYGKNSVAKDKTVGDKISKEEATEAVLDYYSKCDFLKNKDFILDAVGKENYAQETSYKTVWKAEFKEKLDNGILNNFKFVVMNFDVVDGKIHVYFVRESETFNDVYNDKKFEVYNNEIVLTEKQAINYALEKDKSLTGNEVKKSYAFLSNKQMNSNIWLKEHTELTREDLQGEIEIDGQTYSYSKYMFEKNIIRNVYVVFVLYKVEENVCLDANNYATVYYVDATTGEIIGGEPYYSYTYRKGVDLYKKDYSSHTSKIVYYYDKYTNDYLGSYSTNLPQEMLEEFPIEVEWNSEDGNPFGYVN